MSHSEHDVLVASLVAVHPDECDCRRCARLIELPAHQQSEGGCCRDSRERLEFDHALQHHHIVDLDELERAETELAWEEIQE